MSRALVLSGGGSVGIAWQTGLAAGLARHGVDLAAADFIVGTSAGSTVGAQLALGTDMDERVERYRQSAAGQGAQRNTSTTPATSNEATAKRMERFMAIMAEAMDGDATPEEGRAAIGRFALEADALPEEQFVNGFRYLQGQEWPERYACTAVDAETGEFMVWDVKSSVPLDRAVASSCAVPGVFAPITIKGRRYIDGGMRSGTNADLAKGHELVLIISLMGGNRAANNADPRLARYRERIEAEVGALKDAGAQVEIVGPDDAAAAALGLNLMDATRAPTAAIEGLRQGEEQAARLSEVWH
jgi:NTE family protein